MGTQVYRLIVIGSVVASFLVGLHLPALHAMSDHGRPLSWTVVGIVAGLTLATLLGVWVLLRRPGPGLPPSGTDTPATRG